MQQTKHLDDQKGQRSIKMTNWLNQIDHTQWPL